MTPQSFSFKCSVRLDIPICRAVLLLLFPVLSSIFKMASFSTASSVNPLISGLFVSFRQVCIAQKKFSGGKQSAVPGGKNYKKTWQKKRLIPVLEPIFSSDHDWICNACLNWSDDTLELYILDYKQDADNFTK